MLPQAHLTSYSRMSGNRWVIIPSWLSGSWRSFLYRSSVYSCHFLTSSASVRSIPFLSFLVPIFAWNVPLVSLIFLKRSLVSPILLFSSISFHLSLRKAFLSLLAILWNSAFKWVYLPFSPLLFPSLLFSAICKASSDNHFAFLHFFFLRMVLIAASCKMSWTSVHSSSGTLSTRSSSLKQVFVILVSVGQQLRTGLLGVSGSVSLTRLQWNFWLDCGHLKACRRLEKTFYNCTLGCCLEASIPHHRFFY